MSMRRLFTIMCDACQTERDEPGWYSAEVREEAQSEGWKRIKGTDLCPKCHQQFLQFVPGPGNAHSGESE